MRRYAAASSSSEEGPPPAAFALLPHRAAPSDGDGAGAADPPLGVQTVRDGDLGHGHGPPFRVAHLLRLLVVLLTTTYYDLLRLTTTYYDLLLLTTTY